MNKGGFSWKRATGITRAKSAAVCCISCRSSSLAAPFWHHCGKLCLTFDVSDLGLRHGDGPVWPETSTQRRAAEGRRALCHHAATRELGYG